MIRKNQNGVHWLEFEHLANCPRLRHGVFLRHGGDSQGSYASLNLCDTVGDNPAHVKANIGKAAEIMHASNLIGSRQVHGKDICLVPPKAYLDMPPCDALATPYSNVGLMIRHADCQAAIFYDPIQHVLANVHCGWRGSVQNIYAETIRFLQVKFGSDPENLLVGISPSLGPENAEFINYRDELPEDFWPYQNKPNYFDFWAISEMQLMKCGILKEHIEIARICTYANSEDCYSYRRTKIRGGHGTIAILI